jgi:hypothetical protein
VYVEGVGGIRLSFPGSSVRYDVTPKDDGRERRALKDDGRSIRKGWTMTLRDIKCKKIT